MHRRRTFCSSTVAATSLPVNADLEDGYGASADQVAESVALAVGTGVAGLSIEDASDGVTLDLEVAVERLSAAREAIDASGHDVLLVGRADGFFNGSPEDRKSTRLNSSHTDISRMPSSA